MTIPLDGYDDHFNKGDSGMAETKTKHPGLQRIMIEHWVGGVDAGAWGDPDQRELRGLIYFTTAKALAAIKRYAVAGRYRIIAVKRAEVTVTTKTETVRVVT